jgi:hypothetical protein
MKTLLRILRRLLGCVHESTYLERRPLHGRQVMHLVCEDCGHAVPAVTRTAREHRRILRAGTPPTLKARRMPPAEIVDFERRRRQERA